MLVLCIDRVCFLNVIQERVRAAHLVLISPASCEKRKLRPDSFQEIHGFGRAPRKQRKPGLLSLYYVQAPAWPTFQTFIFLHAGVMRGRWRPSQLPVVKQKRGAPQAGRTPGPGSRAYPGSSVPRSCLSGPKASAKLLFPLTAHGSKKTPEPQCKLGGKASLLSVARRS